jgi:hypothetical protein
VVVEEDATAELVELYLAARGHPAARRPHSSRLLRLR